MAAVLQFFQIGHRIRFDAVHTNDPIKIYIYIYINNNNNKMNDDSRAKNQSFQ
jgi:hypothetical protein